MPSNVKKVNLSLRLNKQELLHEGVWKEYMYRSLILDLCIGFEAGWATVLVRRTWKREESFLGLDSNSDRSAIETVTVVLVLNDV
jgi:hypothetical protein